MNDQVIRRVCLFLLWCLPALEILSQSYTSRDNYKGSWENSESWMPAWPVPSDTLLGTNIIIYGNITLGSSLSMSGTASTLAVNDTLTINGDLYLGNNISLVVKTNGVLIVRGNLIINNKPVLVNGGYLIVSGNFLNNSTNYGGSFTSSNNPSRVFILGVVPTVNDPNYPVINCTDTINIHYPNSQCSYGDLADLMNESIYSFYQKDCFVIVTGNADTLCAGETISLSSSGGSVFSWSGPNGFSSSEQNPSIQNSNSFMSGSYTVIASDSKGCSDTALQSVMVLDFPLLNAGSDQQLNYSHATRMAAVLGIGESGTWSLVSGSADIQDANSPVTEVTGLAAGENIFSWTVRNEGCVADTEIVLTVYELFIPSVITPNGDKENEYFVIPGDSVQVELIVFDRWGNTEYTSDHYLNNWNGRNNKGTELPDDTYFYVLKFRNGMIRKGSVLIRR